MADGKENFAATKLDRGESLFENTLFGCQIVSRSSSLSPRPSTQLSDPLSCGLSQELPVVNFSELPYKPYQDAKSSAKQLNMRLMHSKSPQEILALAMANMSNMDSINLTAAFQRIAKVCDFQPANTKVDILASPVFRTMADMLIEECNTGKFNSQSTSNAWWAISKLVPGKHPLAPALFMALETALLGCLAALTESERPNSQAISSIFYAWGRLDGYLPSTIVLQPMWERTLQLSLTFDTQGVANTIWAIGMLKRKNGDAFAIRTDVLSALSFLVQRIIPSFAVQGLSCAAVGCANMGPSLRSSVAPLMESIIVESLRRPQQFTMQAMANLVCAIARIGNQIAMSPETHMLLAAFDVHAARLPPPYKAQELQTLQTSMMKCHFMSRNLRLFEQFTACKRSSAGQVSSSHGASYSMIEAHPGNVSASMSYSQNPICSASSDLLYFEAANEAAVASSSRALPSPFYTVSSTSCCYPTQLHNLFGQHSAAQQLSTPFAQNAGATTDHLTGCNSCVMSTTDQVQPSEQRADLANVLHALQMLKLQQM